MALIIFYRFFFLFVRISSKYIIKDTIFFSIILISKKKIKENAIKGAYKAYEKSKEKQNKQINENYFFGMMACGLKIHKSCIRL